MSILLIVANRAVAQHGGCGVTGQHKHDKDIRFWWPDRGADAVQGFRFERVFASSGALRFISRPELEKLKAFVCRGGTIWIEL